MIDLKYIKSLIFRTIFSLVFLILISTLLKSDNYYYKIHNVLFESSIDFSYIKSKTDFLLGKYITKQNHYVSSENLIYKDIEYIDNKNLLIVDYNYIINSLCDGVVVNKNKNEVIIDCDSNTTIIYENIENININLYDYIKKDTLIGNTINNELLLTIKKEENYLYYEDFIKG